MQDFDHARDGLKETILDGRYRLLESIGDGGMGRVYAAEHITLGKRVAIKVLREEQSQVDANVERFMQEARAASMTNHPNVVDITDVGRTPAGTVFFVMEFLQGEELAVLMHRQTRLPWPTVQQLAIQVCRGLHAAHQAGVVHRDMKPANIFICPSPQGEPLVKLLDFGIAKLQHEGRRPLTGQGSVFGTARYMSPEQAGGKDVDARTDVYSLGVILYEMLTGRAPFEGDNFIAVANRHINDPVPSMQEAAPDVHVPPVVADVVMRALSKDPRDRFASMAEFEAAILGASFESTVATTNPLLAAGVDRTIVYQAEQGRRAREAAVALSAVDATVIRPRRTFGNGQRGGAVKGEPSRETLVRPRPVFGGQPRGDSGDAPRSTIVAQPHHAPHGHAPPPPMLDEVHRDLVTHPQPSAFGQPQVRRGDGVFFAASAMLDADGAGASPVLPAGAAIPSDGPALHHTLPPVGRAPINPSTNEHTHAGSEGHDTHEFSLQVPRTEVSRNIVVMLIAAITIVSIVGGVAAWALFFDDEAPVTDGVMPSVVKHQPQPMALPEPESPPEIRALGPAPISEPVPSPPDPNARPKATPRPVAVPEPEPAAQKREQSGKPRGDGASSAAKGFAKARGAIKSCGDRHGALDGTKIDVAFDVRDGRATNISVQRPYGVTPLGRCIADAVGDKARFSASVKPQRFSRAVSF